MRVVSGSAKGRPLKAVPGTGTRPTTDKVKEALFSMIGPYFDGGATLDLFAGSGGLGIEALSRGMDRAVFIDMEPKAIEVIRENLRKTGLDSQAEVFRNDAGRALKALAKRGTVFDAVFLDPPYRMKHGDELMNRMDELGLLQDGAVVILEYESGYSYPERFGSFNQIRKAVYGETAVSIFRYERIQGQTSGQSEAVHEPHTEATADEEEQHD
ncbi:16S rRNA (guanine(966)-N(2))-methyltransferase RsmD [Paenibacillus sp. P96]|uniref:16S rRNA (Guanine(966)-N(2))-methyltransferase RsmD n=1 Tax=Paenibacillus zeirhizosphaerae TaxID=2987519 RepID=A0ABT9FS96_9BACL|nr:16S rRNA (guanine(966)-N(2))-methyltransferase RsmD [Paenibacillus sp. P96]MDP4097591.1 16S rRNA (guanine(966)-N(2))-methyltransferase RsmD [Paenibacillus sp. P96]